MNDGSKAGAGHAWIRERIARVPRVRLALTPTPLQAGAEPDAARWAARASSSSATT